MAVVNVQLQCQWGAALCCCLSMVLPLTEAFMYRPLTGEPTCTRGCSTRCSKLPAMLGTTLHWLTTQCHVVVQTVVPSFFSTMR